MRWPWLSRGRYMRELTEARKAYRLDLDDAVRREGEAKRELERVIRALYEVEVRDGFQYPERKTIYITMDRRAMAMMSPGNLYSQIAYQIVAQLTSINKDYRGDMRQTETERLLQL